MTRRNLRRILRGPFLKTSWIRQGPSASSSIRTSSMSFFCLRTAGWRWPNSFPCSWAITSIASPCLLSVSRLMAVQMDRKWTYTRTFCQPSRRLRKQINPCYLGQDEHALSSNRRPPLHGAGCVREADVEVVGDDDTQGDQIALDGDVAPSTSRRNEFRYP